MGRTRCATPLPNDRSTRMGDMLTTPGCTAEEHGSTIFFLPGFPRRVRPFLRLSPILTHASTWHTVILPHYLAAYARGKWGSFSAERAYCGTLRLMTRTLTSGVVA